MILTPSRALFSPSGAIFYSLRPTLGNLTIIECLKCFIKCLYQLVFRLGQFLDSKFIYLLNYWRFCDFDTFTGLFSPSGAIFHPLRLNFGNLTTIECLKCNIKCLYQLVFKFGQFVSFKLTYLLNYWRLCDFDPFTGPLSPLYDVIMTSKLPFLKKNNLEKC